MTDTTGANQTTDRTITTTAGESAPRGAAYCAAPLRHMLPELRQRYHVRAPGRVGSYTRGEQGSVSDLDVLVAYDLVPSLFDVVDLEDELRCRLQADVDLVTVRGLRGRIGSRILREVVWL